jgi:cytoskeletal protein CcmA (bactofilin family)
MSTTNRILLAKGPNGSNLDQLFDIKNDDTCGKYTLILKKTYDLSASIVIDNYWRKKFLNNKFTNLGDTSDSSNNLTLRGDLSGNDASFNKVLITETLSVTGDLSANDASFNKVIITETLSVTGDLSANDASFNDVSCNNLSATGDVSCNNLSVLGDVSCNRLFINRDLSGNDASFNDVSCNNLSIEGNLTVRGNTTTVNSTTVTIEDAIFTLGGENPATNVALHATHDKGIEFHYWNATGSGSAEKGFMGYDQSSSKFTMLTNAGFSGEVVVSGTKATLVANLEGDLSLSTALPAAQVTQGTMQSGMVLVAPALGTPASGALTNCTALPAAQVTQGTMQSGMVLVAPALGTPASGVLTNCTGTASGLTAGAVTNGVYTTDNLSVLAASTSAHLAGVISDETGTGSLVFATSPTLVTPALGTPASGVLTNCTGTAAGLTAGAVTITGRTTATGTPQLWFHTGTGVVYYS